MYAPRRFCGRSGTKYWNGNLSICAIVSFRIAGRNGLGVICSWRKGDVDGRELELVVRGYVNAAMGGMPVVPVLLPIASDV